MAVKKVGTLVKEARTAAGLTQEKLARAAGDGLSAAYQLPVELDPGHAIQLFVLGGLSDQIEKSERLHESVSICDGQDGDHGRGVYRTASMSVYAWRGTGFCASALRRRLRMG